MSRTDVLQRVKSILAKEWSLSPDEVPDDATLNRFEKWDSLGHISVMMTLVGEFGFELNADRLQALQSVPKIVEFLITQGLVAVEEAEHVAQPVG